ncbi:hypothetical protein CY0110_18902 [Crocosphaera chwakensis CCY0110]|uniref:Uncharacterized protein n=1 Tax=Crocosphaera chwakensis CCY0110 TaxID=391612 RepID=A3IJB2_9CHRO|nr:hypothetical protein CY0110_18902 [Crocosphaera chwakensis CCY0110]
MDLLTKPKRFLDDNSRLEILDRHRNGLDIGDEWCIAIATRGR